MTTRNVRNKGGYIVPVAIGVLVVASLGLLIFSWWSGARRVGDNAGVPSNSSATTTASSTLNNQSTANDDATLESDSATIDAQINALDKSNIDVDNSLNDKSTI